MEPCCLGGSPSSFIDQAREVLLLVSCYCSQRLSLIFIFCFLIFLFSFASPCGGVLFCCWCHVTCFFSLVFSFLGFCTRVLSALRPSLVRPFEFTCGFLRVCSLCCAHAWFVFGVAGIQYALAIFFFGRGTSSPSRCHRRTASSVWRAAHCTVHRGHPPLRRHRSVSTLVEASGLC